MSDQKQALLEEMDNLNQKWETLSPDSPQLKHLSRLQEDITQDYFTIVTVGEFKTGKSTFLNALLEDSLLPTNVTPMTAAVHVIYEGVEKDIEVMKKDGEKKTLPLTKKTLEKFTAQSDFDPTEVQYIKVPHTSRLLEGRTILVDTPGVNDLNEHRVEVTHQFLPRADAVIFMIDMLAPLKGAETEFLKDHVLKNGTEHLLFIANFLDQFEEEDEIDETIDFINRRLGKITGENDHQILPLSALESYESIVDHDEQAYLYSGMPEVRNAINKMVKEGTKLDEKLERYQSRLERMKASILGEIDIREKIETSSKEELEKELSHMKDWFDKEEEIQNELEAYMKRQLSEIKYMVFKSMDHFQKNLTHSIMQDIEDYDGDRPKKFVEKQLAKKIQNELTRWVEEYAPSIEHLFHKLIKEICEGLNQTFETNVQMSKQRGQVTYQNHTDIDSPHGGSVQIQTGAIIGTLSAFAITIGASVLFPLVAFVGQPWLSEKMKERKWEKAKPEIKGLILDHLEDVFLDFKQHMNQYLDEQASHIKQQSLTEFHLLMDYHRTMIQNQLEQKNKQAKRHDEFLQELHVMRVELEGRKTSRV